MSRKILKAAVLFLLLHVDGSYEKYIQGHEVDFLTMVDGKYAYVYNALLDAASICFALGMGRRSFFMPKTMGKSKGLEVSTLSGIVYSPDKSKDCQYCYFRKNKRIGCELGTDNCYYCIAETKRTTVSECDGCPYGRANPCIGWCTKKILKEMGMY